MNYKHHAVIGLICHNVHSVAESATDIFESCIRQILERLSGVVNIADDDDRDTK